MQEAYKLVQQFENQLKSHLDQPDSQAGRWLRQEIIRLMDDIETQKNPRSLEGRVKVIKQEIERLDDESVMDHRHQDDLIDRCDDLIQLFRKLS